jgi:PhoPQ-activated pathogenicity-related protein
MAIKYTPALTKVKYMVKATGDRWFDPYNGNWFNNSKPADGSNLNVSKANQLATCKKMSPLGEEEVVS